jgi:putative DNA primase/helicase
MPHATLPRASWHLDAALEWAGLGFAILPLHKPVGIGCSCRRGPACSSPGKHPRTRHGVSDATTDADQLEAWWYRWPDANIGIATGRASGLVVIDVDPRSGGHDYLAQLQHEHGGLPTTVTVRTGGNGWHHYFAGPESEVPGRVLAPGVDLKGDGGYVVAPPSLHVSGAGTAPAVDHLTCS